MNTIHDGCFFVLSCSILCTEHENPSAVGGFRGLPYVKASIADDFRDRCSSASSVATERRPWMVIVPMRGNVVTTRMLPKFSLTFIAY